jgi:hypothetical protein
VLLVPISINTWGHSSMPVSMDTHVFGFSHPLRSYPPPHHISPILQFS